MESLENKSSIIKQKAKFFIIRVVSYFSFLFIPIWAPKILHLRPYQLCLLMTFYIFFMAAQWFLLGKEIDHRLKIYFRVNSSIDRVIYRIFLGMFACVLIFNLMALLPTKWIYNSFWTMWIIQGLFYSWPTRGKIIHESVSSNFSEFRFLDSFEKTLFFLIMLVFIVSIPQIPILYNYEALKLFFDPYEQFSTQFWNFLTVNYFPFKNYPILLKYAWFMHFYVFGAGTFLMLFYAIMRFFVSRRLSMLSVFVVVSTSSFVKINEAQLGASLSASYCIMWVWSLIWVSKSSTYRAGLFLGLLTYWGTILSYTYYYLGMVQILLVYLLYLDNKTPWFRKQLVKYTSFGLALAMMSYFFQLDYNEIHTIEHFRPIADFFVLLNRKSFFSLSYVGIILYFLIITSSKIKFLKNIGLPIQCLRQIGAALIIITTFGLLIDNHLLMGMTGLWVLALFSIIPIEVLFQAISRLRNRRNIYYLVYIIIALLDSHFEGRVKTFIQLFR